MPDSTWFWQPEGESCMQWFCWRFHRFSLSLQKSSFHLSLMHQLLAGMLKVNYIFSDSSQNMLVRFKGEVGMADSGHTPFLGPPPILVHHLLTCRAQAPPSKMRKRLLLESRISSFAWMLRSVLPSAYRCREDHLGYYWWVMGLIHHTQHLQFTPQFIFKEEM